MDAHLDCVSVVHPEAVKAWEAMRDAPIPEPPQVDRETRKFLSMEEAAAATGKPIDWRLRFLFCQPRFEQRSPEWHTARHMAITASDFGPAAGHSEYGSPVQVYRKKVETAPQVFSDFARKCMDHGVKYEDAATHRYEQETGNVVLDFGLLSHWRLWSMRPANVTPEEWFRLCHLPERPDCITPDRWETIVDLRFLKGSPDGITTNGILLEFKCPVSNFVDGLVKRTYFAQVQLNMEIANIDMCHFVQYAPQKTWLFGERYDLVEIPRDKEWFNLHKGNAKRVWEWILFTRDTGDIPPELVPKLRIVPDTKEGEFALESSRKRARKAPTTEQDEPKPQPEAIAQWVPLE